MDYQFLVSYKFNNNLKEKMYSSIKQITIDFNINKELVKNIYMKVPKTQHNIIVSIDRLPVPIKKEKKIVIKFS